MLKENSILKNEVITYIQEKELEIHNRIFKKYREELNIKIKEANKIILDKSCYEPCILYSDDQAKDLNGTLMLFIKFSLPKQDYYLTTEFMCKNVRVVQYSIIKYDGEKFNHSFRIYEVSKYDNGFLNLLENSNPSVPESEYHKNFFFKKTIIVDFSK